LLIERWEVGSHLLANLLQNLQHIPFGRACRHHIPHKTLKDTQGINAGSIGDKGRTVGELARLMYMRGYDLRHFLVQRTAAARLFVPAPRCSSSMASPGGLPRAHASHRALQHGTLFRPGR
jgi:hypothetical protein